MNRTILAALAANAADLPVSPASDRSEVDAWQMGVGLAIELFNESDADESALEFDFQVERGGRPAYNIMLNYLNRLRTLSDARIETAFCAVLSDFLSSACGGSVADACYYERGRFLNPIETTVTPPEGGEE